MNKLLSQRDKVASPAADSNEYQILAKVNHLDIELFSFIRNAFQDQAELLTQQR